MREVVTKTGVILTERELSVYTHIKGIVDRGFFVAFPIGNGKKPEYAHNARKRDLFKLACSKLVSLGLLEVVFDYGWGYAPTKLEICDVIDETQDPIEYSYR